MVTGNSTRPAKNLKFLDHFPSRVINCSDVDPISSRPVQGSTIRDWTKREHGRVFSFLSFLLFFFFRCDEAMNRRGEEGDNEVR